MIDETGGPAFPLDRDCCNVGMTLRDYFAAKAMQAFLRNAKPEDTDAPPSTWAQDAYTFADAMLKERAK
jgi:hypothetical protein